MWGQREGRLSTITQVKVLSPEMHDIALGEGLFVSEASIAARVNGECASNVPGSEAMVGNRTVCTGTWESHIVPNIEASDELKKRRRKYGDVAVGLAHSACWAVHSSGGLKSLWRSDEGRYIQKRA